MDQCLGKQSDLWLPEEQDWLCAAWVKSYRPYELSDPCLLALLPSPIAPQLTLTGGCLLSDKREDLV